jgi:hypothetical protein
VLAAADMTLSVVIHLTHYTTDVDALLGNHRVLAGLLDAAARVTLPSTRSGWRACVPELMAELEATTAR